MNIGDRIKELRAKKGLTQQDMADKLNISAAAYGYYEQGKSSIPYDKLILLANIFDSSLDVLAGRLDDKEQKNSKRIKVFGEVPAGIPIEAIEDVQDFEDISLDEFSISKEYIGLKVKGDSMYPKYLDGDTVIVEVTPTCNNGDEVVVYVNGYNATLKKLIKNNDGTITLMPLNQNYAPRTYGKDDETITVLGVVKQIRRNI